MGMDNYSMSRDWLAEADRTCPEPGGCASCPDPDHCRKARREAGLTTEVQEWAAVNEPDPSTCCSAPEMHAGRSCPFRVAPRRKRVVQRHWYWLSGFALGVAAVSLLHVGGVL